jgi:methyl-accepting chemotaxis protein
LAFDHDNRDSTGEAGRGFAVVASQLLPATAEAADNANRSAGLVLATTHELSDQAGQLRLSVDRFLSNVAA